MHAFKWLQVPVMIHKNVTFMLLRTGNNTCHKALISLLFNANSYLSCKVLQNQVACYMRSESVTFRNKPASLYKCMDPAQKIKSSSTH